MVGLLRNFVKVYSNHEQMEIEIITVATKDYVDYQLTFITDQKLFIVAFIIVRIYRVFKKVYWAKTGLYEH